MIAATLTMLWGCSSSDDDDNNGGGNNDGGIHGVKVETAPNWTFVPGDIEGDIQGKPDWQEVDFYDFDNNMTAIVFVPPVFGTMLTENDRMAAIINGEVRCVCAPVPYYLPDANDSPLLCFMLYIPFESNEDGVDLQYYCAQTNQTYIETNAFSVDDDTVGDHDLFFFFLRPMMARYVVLPSGLPFTPTENDEMAVFMGEECCGTAQYLEDPNPQKFWIIEAYDMNRRNEKVYVRYYSDETKSIYESEPLMEIANNLDTEMPDTLKFK